MTAIRDMTDDELQALIAHTIKETIPDLVTETMIRSLAEQIYREIPTLSSLDLLELLQFINYLKHRATAPNPFSQPVAFTNTTTKQRLVAS